MLGRIAAAAALIALAGCAGMESAGRNASRSPEPARVASAPPQAMPAPTPTPAVTPPPPAAPAPTITAAAPPPRPVTAAPPVTRTQAPPPAAVPPDQPIAATPRDDDDNSTVVVPGVRERQVQPPNGDPRSNLERMQDIRAWDQCVMRVQNAAEADP